MSSIILFGIHEFHLRVFSSPFLPHRANVKFYRTQYLAEILFLKSEIFYQETKSLFEIYSQNLTAKLRLVCFNYHNFKNIF